MVNALRKAVMRSEAEGKRAEDMLHFLDDFADADTGKSSKFQNQEMIMKKDKADPNAPKQATEEVGPVPCGVAIPFGLPCTPEAHYVSLVGALARAGNEGSARGRGQRTADYPR